MVAVVAVFEFFGANGSGKCVFSGDLVMARELSIDVELVGTRKDFLDRWNQD